MIKNIWPEHEVTQVNPSLKAQVIGLKRAIHCVYVLVPNGNILRHSHMFETKTYSFSLSLDLYTFMHAKSREGQVYAPFFGWRFLLSYAMAVALLETLNGFTWQILLMTDCITFWTHQHVAVFKKTFL